MAVDPPTPSTGINHYWTYEEEPLPGIGKAMVNVGSGNLLMQVDDLDIPERGIDLAFRRTYNSQSQHDSSGTDGSTPSVFGNGWTNTFDAHLAYNSTSNVVSVYDIDGARYDYTSNGSSWTPPAGQYAQLTSDGACGFYWTKRNGTTYYFEAPNQPSTCGTQIPAGLLGRIMAIDGRNINNSLTFTYSWANGDDTNPENLTQIVVAHSDGQWLTLTFGLLNGTGPDELVSINRPDGSLLTYEYDSTGDLLEVDRPGNNTISAQNCTPTPPIRNLNCIAETYTYNSGYLIATANSPRYTLSQYDNGGTATEGDTINFAFDTSRRATSMTDYGVVNFVPQDGVSPGLPAAQQPLQPSPVPTGLQTWYTETFSGYGAGVTTVSDTDGHSRMWTTDSLWRVTEMQEWTGSRWLVSNESWDTNDNLLTFTDERGNMTTFAYDGNGNAIMEAQPSITSSMGTFQPTAWYQYDQYNNLLYYCDPNWVHQHSGDYPNGSNPCMGTPNGVVHYVWSTGSAPEIYGQLADTYTPLGYHHHLSYDSNGMPLSVVGDSISQADGTQRTPDQAFTYDGYGNLQTYNPGYGAWHLTYDNLNRLKMREDPDAVYSYICYYADGSTQYTESSYQRQLDNGPTGAVSCATSPPVYAVSYLYDADGDIRRETHHHGGTYNTIGPPTLPGTADITNKFYDADDRLVEVAQPYDSGTDLYQNPWITRYVYDLSQNGTLGSPAFYGQNLTAHGNLYKTVELLPPGGSSVTYGPPTTNPTPTPIPNTVYQDMKGTAFDALDRPTAKYSIITASASQTLSTESLTYDSAPSLLGFLGEDCNAVSQCQSFSYDPRGSESQVTFSDSTPSRTMEYDPDGRTISVTSATFGSQSYTYDADGRLTTSQDPSGSGVTSPALLTHHYYADGKEESLDVSSSALTQSGLFTYSYRADGVLQTEAIDDASVSGIVNAGTTTLSYSYTSAGRLTERSESGAAANGTPRIITRNGSGLETAESFSGASLSTMEYDAEGSLLGITPSSQGLARYTYNARGELSYAPAEPLANGFKFYADGTLLQVSEIDAGVTWDDRMGVTLGSCNSCSQGGSAWLYDGAGRMQSESMPSGPTGAMTTGTVRTYDAENHTLTSDSQNLPNRYPPNAVIKWGPNGHPIEIGTSTTTSNPTQLDTLHWDGDELLFTTDYLGQVDDIKAGAQGDVLPLDRSYNGLTFFDRDPSGTVMGCHNAAGAVFAGINDPFDVPLKGSSNNKSPCGSTTVPMPRTIVWWGSYTGTYYNEGNGIGAIPTIGAGAGVLGMPRTDGYTDGLDTIQGVRTYDSNAGTWTTPDVYEGDVDDPASQKSYMWNSNNPVGYADPAGYCSDPGGSGVRVCIDAFIQQSMVMSVMRGDNRGFERNSKSASYRVEVDISFGKQDGHITLGNSHLVAGGIVLSFRPTNIGSTINVHGNIAVVHINVIVGGPMGLNGHAPGVTADLVVALNKDGSMWIVGFHSQFPSWEAYCYGCSSSNSGWKYTETPRNGLGPLFLALGENAGVIYIGNEETEEQEEESQKESDRFGPTANKN